MRKYKTLSFFSSFKWRLKVPLTKSRLQRINDCLDMMSKRLDEIEEQRIREDAEDEIEALRGERLENPLEAPPNAPFYSDSPPAHIHGAPKRDLFG